MEFIIYGGPPWGLRISNDEELRPVVAKLLPGGRGELNGLKIGDMVLSVDGVTVGGTVEAQELIQKAKERLALRIRSNDDSFVEEDFGQYEQDINEYEDDSFVEEDFESEDLPDPIQLRGAEMLQGYDDSTAELMENGDVNVYPNSEDKSEVYHYSMETKEWQHSTVNRMSTIPNEISRLRERLEGFVKFCLGFRQTFPCFVTLSIDGYHSTKRKEKLSTSNQNTPVAERKELSTVTTPTTPVFPRTNPHFSRNSPVRQIKLDIQGIKGTTELKRRLFESESSKSPATDRLLQRKIQMGYMHGVPSESTTGYDSVCGDFAGESSNRTSPLSSIMQEEEIDERTIHEDHQLPDSKGTLSGSMNQHDANQMFGPAGGSSSQWEMKTENTNGKPADGEIEVPGRRSVAALRQAITTQLEMKAPIGSQARNKIAGQELDGRNTPTYNRSSVRVYEDTGLDEISSKPYFGRVLDGPVAENKYYQGVPPPSYSLCHSPAPSSCASEPQYKPPISPKKETKGLRNSFLNRIATVGLKEEGEEDVVEETEGDGQTASDFYHSLYDKEGSQRTVNMIPEQTARGPATIEDAVVIAKNPEENTVIIASSSINNPRIVNDMPTANAYSGDAEKEYLRPISSELSSVPEDPKSSTNSTSTSPRRISMDLESSDIFKSRSPAPFNAYSTNNTNHYATLRRNHSPVSIPYSPYSSGCAPIDENHNVPASFSNNIMNTSINSQMNEQQDSRSTDNYMLQSQLFDSIFSDKNSAGDSGAGIGREPERCATAAQTADSPAHLSMDQLQSPRGREDIQGGSMPSDGANGIGSAHFWGPSQTDPDMSNWYRNMYKKMHKIDPETDSVLQYQQLRDQSPAPATTISRPLTPSLHVQRPSSRFECELTPRRAKSVGRVIEPPVSPNQYAVERGRTAHFHLPSYKFRDEDRRALLTNGCRCVRGAVLRGESSASDVRPLRGPATISCLRCHLPRREPSWNEIEYLYKCLGSKEIQKEIKSTNTQNKIAHRYISDRLESTAEELERFIQSLDISWKRTRSQPSINIKREKEAVPSSNLADEIAELKRISKEELMYRQKAEKLSEELANEKQRRHGYIPSAAPSLQKNFDRFESLLNDYGGPSTTAKQPVEAPRNANTSVVTATVVYQFVAKSPRELSLNKGDVVRINREIDANWMEGERNGNAGIFPRSYVQINDLLDSNVIRLRVIYPFTARNSNELSLKLGEMMTYRRDIDANWIEGANHLAEIGIFPKSYVREEAEQIEPASSVIPDRPKTPKITTTAEPVFDIDYESPPREIRPSVHFQSDDHEEMIRQSAEVTRQLYEKRKQEIVQQILNDAAKPDLAMVGFERSRPDSRLDEKARFEQRGSEASRRQEVPQHQSRFDDFAPEQQVHPSYERFRPAGMAQFAPRETEAPRRHEVPIQQPRFDDFAHEQAAVGPSFERSRPAGMAQFAPRETKAPRRHEVPIQQPRFDDFAHEQAAVGPSFERSRPADSRPPGMAQFVPKGSETYRAVYPYRPQKQDELELEQDDIIFVVEKCDDGWFIGTLLRNGKFGTFPGNYVQRH